MSVRPFRYPFVLHLFTILIIHAVTGMIPASLWAWQIDFTAGPLYLGGLSLGITLGEIFMSFLAGRLNDFYGEKKVLSMSVLLTAFILAGIGIAHTFWLLLLFCIALGASHITVAISIDLAVSHMTLEEMRGKYFSQLRIAAILGMLLGVGFMTIVSTGVFYNITGWRLAYAAIGLLFLMSFFFYGFCFEDPHVCEPPHESEKLFSLKPLYQIMLRFPNSYLILAELCVSIGSGITGFLILWLQLIGFHSYYLSALAFTIMTSYSAGIFLGGWISDYAHHHHREKGRIWIFQASLVIGFLFALVLFQLLPISSAYFWVFLFFGSVHAFFGYWTVNTYLLASFVEEEFHGMGFSALRFATAIGNSFGVFLIGFAAQALFGYSVNDESEFILAQAHPYEADALGDSLLLIYGASAFIACCFYVVMLYNLRQRVFK